MFAAGRQLATHQCHVIILFIFASGGERGWNSEWVAGVSMPTI